MAITAAAEPDPIVRLLTIGDTPEWSGKPKDVAMTTRSRIGDGHSALRIWIAMVADNALETTAVAISTMVASQRSRRHKEENMLTLTSRTRSRSYTLAVVILAMATFGVLTATASAGIVDLGKHSAGDIKKHCDAAGGVFSSGGGYYGCAGPGGDVICSKGKCQGDCSKCGTRQAPEGGITGVLPPRGGNAPPPATPTGPKGKTGLGNVPVVGNKDPGAGAQPVTIQRSGGGGHSGKH